jgi:hypothetical protein
VTAKGFIINGRGTGAKRPEYAFPEFLAYARGDCAKKGNPDDFTETSTLSYGYAARARAMAVCHECPFEIECGQWAAETGQTGVWGGQWFERGIPNLRRGRRRNAA